MNLRLIYILYNLWDDLKSLKGKAMGNMGWKTITGALLVGLGYAAKALVSFEASFDQIGDGLIAAGAVLGGVGLRAAIAKK